MRKNWGFCWPHVQQAILRDVEHRVPVFGANFVDTPWCVIQQTPCCAWLSSPPAHCSWQKKEVTPLPTIPVQQ